MTIDYVKIELTPVAKRTWNECALRIVVTAGAKRFTFQHNYSRDDLKSHFDEIFDRARSVLRDGLEHPERFEKEPWEVML